MPDQKDYGKAGDATLVPGTLIAYRHFNLSSGGRVTPMMRTRMGGGIYSRPGFTPFEAECRRYDSTPPHNYRNYVRNGSIPDYAPAADHKAPSVDCTCGFYAHYSPTEDFYRYSQWSAPSNENFFGGVDRQQGAMLRAVVELSGTVVVGSRGVRAQKLRIKALCIDWAKYIPPRRDFTRVANDIDVDYILRGDSIFARTPSPQHEEQLREDYEEHCRLSAEYYGADYFTNPAEMYAAYPQPDLSHLDIPEPTPYYDSANYIVSNSQLSQFQHQFISARKNGLTAAMQELAKAVGEASKAVADASARAGFVLAPTPASRHPRTAYLDAIVAKKNRPAPPGTGIDRRKRKL